MGKNKPQVVVKRKVGRMVESCCGKKLLKEIASFCVCTKKKEVGGTRSLVHQRRTDEKFTSPFIISHDPLHFFQIYSLRMKSI